MGFSQTVSILQNSHLSRRKCKRLQGNLHEKKLSRLLPTMIELENIPGISSRKPTLWAS